MGFWVTRGLFKKDIEALRESSLGVKDSKNQYLVLGVPKMAYLRVMETR